MDEHSNPNNTIESAEAGNSTNTISISEISSSFTGAASDQDTMGKQPDVKKTAQDLIQRYYRQITAGCGAQSCKNPNCASSSKFQFGNVSSNEAAVKALQLFSENGAYALCGVPASIKPSVSEKSKQRQGNTPTQQMEAMDTTSSSLLFKGDVNPASALSQVTGRLTEELMSSTIDECKAMNSYAKLRILLWSVFSNEAALKRSFLCEKPRVKYKNNDSNLESCSTSKDVHSKLDCDMTDTSDSDNIMNDCSSDSTNMKDCTKEQIRAFERDLDKDIDSLEGVEQSEPEIVEKDNCFNILSDSDGATSSSNNSSTIDVESLRRVYAMLFEKCPEIEFSDTLQTAISRLLWDTLSIQIKIQPEQFRTDPLNANVFIILLENPFLPSSDFEFVLADLSKIIALLGPSQQATLVKHLATYWTSARLHELLQALHHLITMKLLTTEFNRDFTINEEKNITASTELIKIIYYACIYGGEKDKPLLIDVPQEKPSINRSSDLFLDTIKEGIGRPPAWDNLAKELKMHPLDGREPMIPFSEFYNDVLSDQLEMDRDFAYYKAANDDKFSFLNYPFILTPVTKSLGLYYDNRIQMHSERRISVFQTVMEGVPPNPYLNLSIRRDHIINDALMGLELAALDHPQDLKKQLVVEFEGEQGLDEGGISKEFFQLIIEQLFNPDYAMFCLNNETQTFWFNPTSFESGGQFSLVGIVLGLAIYNNVILDVHFPPVMYKKLCGKPGSFQDLEHWNPTLYRSLLDVLKYEGDDIEDVFVQTFRIGYQDVFGANLHHDLKPDGENILVNQSNKQEFVSLYADFLLNKMVEQQFSAFRKGFWMVTDDSPLLHFFRPQELELLVCGSQNYDFCELMNSTKYDNGYESYTNVITWFWELVHDMDEENKKQLLQFTTGSSRVPLGGLSRLKLIIARHGSDTDRLPTAHTCFNILLLPEYSTKEKLKDRLLKAIKYAHGFGML